MSKNKRTKWEKIIQMNESRVFYKERLPTLKTQKNSNFNSETKLNFVFARGHNKLRVFQEVLDGFRFQ